MRRDHYNGHCSCTQEARTLSISQIGVRTRFVRTAGWLCVHCGRGKYVEGRCSSCGAQVTRLAAIPAGVDRLGGRTEAA